MTMSSLRLVCLATVALSAIFGSSEAYRDGQNWGYKTEIHHPGKSKYGHNDGYSITQYHNSGPSYHKSEPSYHKSEPSYHHAPAKYTYKEDEYEMEKPRYNYKKMKSYSKSYYPEPAKPKEAPKKEEEEHMGIKIDVETPLKAMFAKFGKEEEEKKEEPEEPEGYGYEKKAPKEEEEKKFEISIPKIDIDKMMPSFKTAR